MSPAKYRALFERSRVLLADGDPRLREELARRSYDVTWCNNPEQVLALASRESFDVVLADSNLGASESQALARALAERYPMLPVILVGCTSVEAAVKGVQTGAFDFVVKPVDLGALILRIDRAIRHFGLEREVHRLRSELTRNEPRFPDLLGKSPPMLELFRVVQRSAESEATVLITGESGVGKELVARAIHQTSRRHAGPFIAVNCGALPGHLLESEFFGHLKGAFTDARAERLGVLREAEGGTLFLDEIGELPLTLQPKLLRAIQERRVRPVGSDREFPVDVRIVCATNADLQSAVERGAFRGDLYYRLDVVHVEVPPLRARGTDVLLLAQAFLERIARRDGKPVRTLSPRTAEYLLSYDWPGNVRELLNVLERSLALSEGSTVLPEDLPQRLRKPQPFLPDPTEPTTLLPLAEMERRYILKVLEIAKGNKTKAAETLQVDRSTLYRKLSHYEGKRSEPFTLEGQGAATLQNTTPLGESD